MDDASTSGLNPFGERHQSGNKYIHSAGANQQDLSRGQQRAALLGLLVSGGALITGAIPNIVAANRLGITSREWARVGLGTAAILLILCFVGLSAQAFFS